MVADCGALLRNIRWVMDNMKSHHAKAVKNLLVSSGIRYIYLPPYSPDLNPIEKLWSTVKSFLRKFKARTLDALPNAIQCAFQTVSPSDCSGWFHSCGHSPYFENCYKTHFAGAPAQRKIPGGYPCAGCLPLTFSAWQCPESRNSPVGGGTGCTRTASRPS